MERGYRGDARLIRFGWARKGALGGWVVGAGAGGGWWRMVVADGKTGQVGWSKVQTSGQPLAAVQRGPGRECMPPTLAPHRHE